jgi:aldose 1-epimerase
MKTSHSLILCIAILIASCTSNNQPINPNDFQTTIDGKDVNLYYIQNDTMKVAITNYGSRIVGIWVPDKTGKLGDVNIGYSSINDYLNTHELYYGALVGRYANRICKGKITLNGETYQLPINNGINHLHGGPKGISQQVWDVKEHTSNSITLAYTSKDGEEGYPGNLEVEVIISVSNNNSLNFDFQAKTDKSTVVNLTNHSFFNLAGEGTSINDHYLTINAPFFTPIDSTLIPLGIIDSVENTPFDFQTAKKISQDINVDDQQLLYGRGFDHNFVLKDQPQKEKFLAAEVYEETSGRILQVWTVEPGLQFYSGNFMNGADKGKYGNLFNYRTAFCLETQHFPDSPNHPMFPSTVLNPNETYRTSTSYVFKIKK